MRAAPGTTARSAAPRRPRPGGPPTTAAGCRPARAGRGGARWARRAASQSSTMAGSDERGQYYDTGPDLLAGFETPCRWPGPRQCPGTPSITDTLIQANEGKQPATDATVAQLLERWLEMADLAWSTRVTYKGYIERTILPTLGHLPLRRLDTATLDRFYSELRGRGGVGGRPMAPGHRPSGPLILRRALDQAARWGWIPANPAALASPPRLGSAEIRPPTPEEVSRLLETAYEPDPDLAVLLRGLPRRRVPGGRGAVRAAMGERRPGGGRAPDPAQPVPGRRALGGEGTPRPTLLAGWCSPTTACSSWMSIGVAAPSGRRRVACGSPRRPTCSLSTRLAGSPCTQIR